MKPVADDRTTVFQTDAKMVALLLGIDLSDNPEVSANTDRGGQRVTLIITRDYVHAKET